MPSMQKLPTADWAVLIVNKMETKDGAERCFNEISSRGVRRRKLIEEKEK